MHAEERHEYIDLMYLQTATALNPIFGDCIRNTTQKIYIDR